MSIDDKLNDLIDSSGIIRAIKDDVFESAEEIETMLNSLPSPYTY